MAGTISIRAFAKECGVSDTTIHLAIAAGHIDKGVDWNEDKTKKLGVFRDIALREWKSNHSGADRKTKSGTLNLNAIPIKGSKAVASKTQQHIEPPEDGPKTVSTAEIKRSTAAVDYQLKKIELEKKKGALVEKNEVYKQLFNSGKAVREAIMIIPDRIIDNIMAAKNRAEAHTILFKELESALEELSRLPNLQFTSETA